MADPDGSWTMSGRGRPPPWLSKAKRSAAVVLGRLGGAVEKQRVAVAAIESLAGTAAEQRRLELDVLAIRGVADRLRNRIDFDHTWSYTGPGARPSAVARAAAIHPAAVVEHAAEQQRLARRKAASIATLTAELTTTVELFQNVLADYQERMEIAADGVAAADADYATAEVAARPTGCPLLELPDELLAMIFVRVGPITDVRDGHRAPVLPYVCRGFRRCWDTLIAQKVPVWNPWTLPLEMRPVTDGSGLDHQKWKPVPIWTQPMMGNAKMGDLRLCGHGPALFPHCHTFGTGVALVHGDRLIPLDPVLVAEFSACAMARRGSEVAVICYKGNGDTYSWRVDLDTATVLRTYCNRHVGGPAHGLHALTNERFGTFVVNTVTFIAVVHQGDGAELKVVWHAIEDVGPAVVVHDAIYNVGGGGLVRRDIDTGGQTLLFRHEEDTVTRVYADRTSWPRKTLILSTAVDHDGSGAIRVHVLDAVGDYVGTIVTHARSPWPQYMLTYVDVRRDGGFGLKIGHDDGHHWHSQELCVAL